MNRNQKASQIFSEVKSIRKITKNHYAVESQNSDNIYNIRKLPKVNVWTCECKDFHFRLRKLDDKHCKHIKLLVISFTKTSAQIKS